MFCNNNNDCNNNEKCEFVNVKNENFGVCCFNEISNSAIYVQNNYLKHEKIGFCPSKLSHFTRINNILNLKDEIFFNQKG